MTSNTDEGADRGLERLVRQRLMERTEHMSDAELLAFTDGWTSLLELLGRADLWSPASVTAAQMWAESFVLRIKRAQAEVLDSPHSG